MDLDGLSALNLFCRFTGPRSVDPKRKELIEKLPSLKENDLDALDQKDSSCPICFTPFLALLASEEMASAMESPALSVEDLGVTRLADTCGHLFCRKDITTWIQRHDTCPTCRRPFITRPTPANSDGIAQDNNNSGFGLDGFNAELLEEEILEELQTILRAEARVSQGPAGGQTRQNEPDEGGRNEFVGMYS